MSMFKLPVGLLAIFIAVVAISIAHAHTKDGQHSDGGKKAIQSGGTTPDDGSDAMPGMIGPMSGHMMTIMFIIADADEDGALSFEEVTTIHKRIFDAVDANKDGKVTPDELESFMHQK